MEQIKIKFGRNGDFQLEWKIAQTRFAQEWANLVRETALTNVPIRHEKIFSGFNDHEVEVKTALKYINAVIDIINKYDPIINTRLTTVHDQETLNYLHHIFEIYHGSLDDSTDYYHNAPWPLRKNLSNLNVFVHLCESLARSYQQPVIQICYTSSSVIQPKNYQESDYREFTRSSKFGDICLCYVEVGKTLLNVIRDRDEVVFWTGIKPRSRFYADFGIQFVNIEVMPSAIEQVMAFYNKHEAALLAQGITNNIDQHVGLPVVAELNSNLTPEEIIQNIKDRQKIYSIEVS